MTEVSGASNMTFEQVSIGVDRPADTCAKRQHDRVFDAACCALPNFTEKRGLPVVQDERGHGEKLSPVKTFYASHSARHGINGASITGCQTRCTHTDACRS